MYVYIYYFAQIKRPGVLPKKLADDERNIGDIVLGIGTQNTFEAQVRVLTQLDSPTSRHT